MESARAEGKAVSLIVIDVDHFKLVNDTYGHLQGDDVLVAVAELLRKNLRTSDVAARYAGDEFVVLLPDTSSEAAREVADRICAGIRGHTFFLRDRPGSVVVTSSMGLASFPEHAADYDTLFAAADRALYQVKRQGRDGVAIASNSDEEPTHLPLSIERFVGRVDELRALVKLLEDASEGHPKVVAVSGEAGVGKTTLIKQLEPEVRLRAGSLVTGRAHEADVQAPYAPWAEVISAIRRLDVVPRHPWRELPRLVPALGDDAPFEDSNVGSKYMLLEEIAEFIRLAARERPLVIILDDMQWADSASWDTLEYLIPQLENERLLICLTIRAEETYGETLERRRRLSRNELFNEITLSRLTRDEMKQWVEAAFHRQDVGRELLSFLYRHTEGNPLFVVQVLRTLVDEGAVWYTGERWEWRPVSELRLPVGVSDLISRRLSRLTAEAQTILTTAAVIGREFDIDLAIDAGAGSEEELLDAVDEGIRASVLQATADRGSDRYTFTHGKMAEVLRESVNPRRLRRMHERVAQALERRTPDAAAEISMHYDRGGNTDKAYSYAIAAADRAKSVYAHTEGTEFLRIAERNAANPAHLAEVRTRLAQIAEAVGQYVEAQELCDLAINWFDGQNDRPRSLSLRVARERLRGFLGRPARETLEACLALDAEAKQIGLEAERIPLLKMISQAHWRVGETEAGDRVAKDAVDLAEKVGDPALLAESLSRLAVALQRDDPERAIEIHKRSLALCEQLGDRYGLVRSHNNISIIYIIAGQWEEAKSHLNTAISIGRMAGAPDMWGMAALNLGVVHLKAGEFDRARELFGESLALFAAAKNSERQLYALYNLAHLDRDRHEFESAAELYDVASSLAQRIGHSDVEIGAMAGAGLSLLAQGKPDPARRAYHTASERMRTRTDWFQGRELVVALRVHLLALEGKLDEAMSTFEEALALMDTSDGYSAAWLTSTCAEVLLPHAPDAVRGWVERYSAHVQGMGYGEMNRKFEEILTRS